jgi:hypothetical protein
MLKIKFRQVRMNKIDEKTFDRSVNKCVIVFTQWKSWLYLDIIQTTNLVIKVDYCMLEKDMYER